MENLKNLSTEELIKLLQESEAKVAKLEGENGELAKLEQELDKVKSDRNNLSAENEKLMERNTSLANENIEYKEKCAMLEVKIRDLNEELEKALKRNANSIQSNKNTAQRRYVTPSEKNRNIDFGPNVLNECEELAEKEKPGRKAGGLNLNNLICDKNLETVTIDYTDEELEVLNKEGRLERFGEDIFVKLIKQETKEVYKWVKVIRPKYINKATNKIVQKENTEAFKKCMVDSTVIADVINAKMNLGVPIERQAQYFQSMGIDLSSSLLSRYMMMAANSLQPIYDKLLESLINNSNNVIHCDETPLKVLENQKERIWSYMFVLATSIWDRPIYIYDFNMTRKTDNIEEYLKDYRGYLTVDAYPGYDKFKDDYVPKSKELNTFNLAGVQSCITHLRRLFVEVDPSILIKKKKATNNMKPASSAAYKVVQMIGEIFKLEESFKTKKYTKEQIQKHRNTIKYNKLLTDLKEYVESLNPAQGTKLAKACRYLKNNWNEFTTFQKYGGLDITNSLCERAVKPFAVSRKAFLFCKSNNGAKATGILFSIVQTARANGLYVEGYLNYIFKNLDSKPASELLPWSKDIPSEIKIKFK